MGDLYNLQRFVKMQKEYFPTALREIKNGRKVSHWMWWIFPQLKELGYSSTSKYYGISGLEEAKAYLKEPYLRENMQTICNVLLVLDTNDAHRVMGAPDDLKLRSSMTLFALADSEIAVFKQVLDKFYKGQMDAKTVRLLGLIEKDN